MVDIKSKPPAGSKEGLFIFFIGALVLGIAWILFNVEPVPPSEQESLFNLESVSPSEQEFSAFLAAAEQGDVDAQFNVGLANKTARGVPEDAAKAVEWFTKAAEQGHVDAHYQLGLSYAYGYGVPKDAAKAVEWYTKAAEQGHVNAQLELGSAYNYGQVSFLLKQGEGVTKDAAKAVEWWTKAAEQGNATAQLNLGWAYDSGEGVPKDAAKAVEWYTKAAEQGNATAQLNLGLAYNRGEGVPKDAAKAVEWWTKAAEQGHVDAQFNVGLVYNRGEGVPKDAAKAVEWWIKAAEQGHASAQYNVGWAYRYGEGVPEDMVLAYAWFNLASVNGDKPSVQFRDYIEAELSAVEKAEAQRLSSGWKKGQVLVREGSTAGAKANSSSGMLVKQGTGTAFFVSKLGQAVTNHHVVGECKEVRIEGRDGVVTVTTSDRANDLALLQVPYQANVTATINSHPENLRQGDDIAVFGFPLNSLLSAGGNLTPGIVSALTGLGNNTSQIQITASIQPGSSGSPVMNNKGEVVGVVSMKLSDSKMVKATGQIAQSVNFAVSGQTLKSFLDAHHVDYSTGGLMRFNKNAADLADEARDWTTVVECWK